METERRLVVARAWGDYKEWGDENVLEFDSGDDRTTL